MRSFFHFLDDLMPLAPFASARQVVGRRSRMGGGDLIVLTITTKVMRRARIDRQGRHVPAVTAPLLICTHRATGKVWPKHGTNRVWKAVA